MPRGGKRMSSYEKLMRELSKEWLDDSNEFQSKSKVTEADMQKYATPEGITESDRFNMYLKNGLQTQLMYVAANLWSLGQTSPVDAYTSVLTGLCKKISETEAKSAVATEFLIATAEGLQRSIDRSGLATYGNAWKSVWSASKSIFGDSKEEVKAAWQDCIVSLCSEMSDANLQQLVPEIILLGDVSEKLQKRELCARLLPVLCSKLHTADSSLVLRSSSLAQDIDASVRLLMAKGLPPVIKTIDIHSVSDQLVPCCQELLSDEEEEVRAGGVVACTGLLEVIPSSHESFGLIFDQLCDCLENCPPEILEPVVHSSGTWMWAGKSCIQAGGVSKRLLNILRQFLEHTSGEIRASVAFNLPAYISIFSPENYSSTLLPFLAKLVVDPVSSVRVSTAKTMGAIMDSLGPDRTCSYIRDPMVSLLEDKDSDVLMASLPFLKTLCECMKVCNAKPLSFRTVLSSVFSNIQPEIRNFRLHMLIAEALENASDWCPEAIMHDCVIPSLTAYLLSTGNAAKPCLCNTIIKGLKASRSFYFRLNTIQQLVRDLARAPKFRQRQDFLILCRAAPAHFSSDFFTQHFASSAGDLLLDVVPSVRVLACSLYPMLMVLTKGDDARRSGLEEAMRECIKHREQSVRDAGVAASSAHSSGQFKLDRDQDDRNKADELLVQRMDSEQSRRRLVEEATNKAASSSSAARTKSVSSILKPKSSSTTLGRKMGSVRVSKLPTASAMHSVPSSTESLASSGFKSARGTKDTTPSSRLAAASTQSSAKTTSTTSKAVSRIPSTAKMSGASAKVAASPRRAQAGVVRKAK